MFSLKGPAKDVYYPRRSRFMAARTIFFIPRKAWIIRLLSSGELCCSRSSKPSGTICHDTPYLSFSQSHCASNLEKWMKWGELMMSFGALSGKGVYIYRFGPTDE
jgi:hypothetical protein